MNKIEKYFQQLTSSFEVYTDEVAFAFFDHDKELMLSFTRDEDSQNYYMDFVHNTASSPCKCNLNIPAILIKNLLSKHLPENHFLLKNIQSISYDEDDWYDIITSSMTMSAYPMLSTPSLHAKLELEIPNEKKVTNKLKI